MLDTQATALPSSASRPAESPPSQREKRKKTRTPSPEPGAKRARTQSPSDSVSSVGSIEVWPESSSDGVEYDSDEGITEQMRESEARLLAVMSGNDPTYFPPSDSEDEIEVEDDHTPARPHQHTRGRLMSPELYTPARPCQRPQGHLLSSELLGNARLASTFHILSAREAISSISPQERWRPPPTALPLREKSHSPVQETRQSHSCP
ncbi:hypothetical protein ACQKWADRAFT_293233 [Trichoderma austrokoningii]